MSSLLQKNFLGFADLKWFAYIFGGVCSALTLVELLRMDQTWADWVYFLGFLTPMATCFVLMLMYPTKVLYIKANWYIGFFTFILAFFFYVAQSVLLVLVYLKLIEPPTNPIYTTAAKGTIELPT